MNKALISKAICLAVLFNLLVIGEGRAQKVVADYTFADTLASEVGTASDLQLIGSPIFQTESVDGVNRRVLAFPAGNGCRLLSASQTLGDSYTIVALFRFDSISSWRRVIDFRNRKTDWGLYSYYGNLNFFNIITGVGGAIQPDAYVQIALTRNAQGTVRGYVNGVAEIDFSDSSPQATLDSDDILSFFQDDAVVPNEHAAGAVSRIRIWDGPLSESAVAALDRAPGSSTISPPVISSDLDISVTSGAPLNYTLTASNNPISFSGTNLEPWMTFDAELGTLTGTAGAPGVYDVGVSAFNAGGSDSKTLRITVNPSVGSSVGFSVASVRVLETSGTLEVTVLRQGDTTGSASVNYATQDGSALDGVNYTAASGTLDFAAGETQKLIVIDLHWVAQSEPDMEFTLALTSPVNTIVAQPNQMRIVIEDVALPDVSPPTNVMASDGTYTDKVVITWTPSTDGTHYRVYRRATDNSDAFQSVSSWSTATEFSDLSGVAGKVYKYWVRAAKAGAGAGPYSQLDTGYRNLPPSNAPTNLMASDGTYTDRVWLTWSASSDATHYKVYRRDVYNSDEFQAVSSWRTATSFPDFNAEPGKSYKYWVRAAKSGSGLGLSPYSALDTGYQDLPPSSAPTNVTATDGSYSDRVWVVWSPPSGATHYRVFRRAANNSDELQPLSWWREGTSFPDFTAEPGKSYKYWVVAAKSPSGLGASGYSQLDTGYQKLEADAPTNVTATDGSYTDRVWVVWSPPSGATHYKVYRRAYNNSDALQAISGWRTGTSFPDFTAEPGKSYKYWVKAAKSDSGLGESGYSPLDTGYRGAASASASDEALASVNVEDPESSDAGDAVADPAESGYDAWAAGFDGIPADKAGRLDDADGDGTTNVMELFHGTSPVDAAERGGITVLPRTGDEPVKISLKIGKDTPPGVGEILWSSDRVNWQSAGELTNGVNVTLTERTVDASHANHDVVEITATVTYGSPENLYLKLKVDTDGL